MLLTSEIKIKMNRGNLGYYNKVMSNKFKVGDEVIVPIEFIPKSMYVEVDVRCDICLSENKTTYRNYNDCLNYGFYSCMGCKHIKRKLTNKLKHGVDNFVNVNKRRETMFNKYGFYNNNRDKSEKTCLERYGKCNVSQIDEVKYLKKTTMSKNWGVDNPTYIKENKYIYSIDNYVEYKIDEKLHRLSCDKGHIFEISTNLFYSRHYKNVNKCTICYPIDYQVSIGEKEVYNFIKEKYTGEIIQSYRDGLEIDIYLPEINIGFEFNGLYYHSDKFKDNNYHLYKTNFFREKGIKIIHIWEDDWYNKKDIIKSMILNKIGLSEKIFARKCTVKIISDYKISRNFLNINHIQGFGSNNRIIIGLFSGDDIVGIMSFNNLEGRKKLKEGNWNLNRFCNKLNTSVVGGASKLLSFFIKNYNPESIISYSDYAISDGALYEKLGFEMLNKTYPDYKYILNGTRKHKSGFKKEKLGIKNELITENEYTKKIGLYRIYDCGKIKYKLLIK